MLDRRKRRLLCFHCAVPLTRDDREHYGYQCHGCVVREHELVLTLERDPDHPELGWLDGVPVDIGLGRPAAQAEEERRDAA